MKRALPIIILLLITAGIAAYLYIPSQKDVDTGLTDDSPLLAGKNAIFVPDQRPTDEVHIGFAVLSRKGFVVVHNDEAGPGRVLGASAPLGAGRHEDLRIAVDEPLGPGYYYAALYEDDSDGAFTITEDRPIRDGQEAPIMMRFLVTEDAPGDPPAASL